MKSLNLVAFFGNKRLNLKFNKQKLKNDPTIPYSNIISTPKREQTIFKSAPGTFLRLAQRDGHVLMEKYDN